jgi:hypothetical protein
VAKRAVFDLQRVLGFVDKLFGGELHAKRWGIEPSFRDTKDLRFGLGMSHTHIKNPERRGRMSLLNALGIFLMTLLGAAGESLGFDRLLKANTVKYRPPFVVPPGLYVLGADSENATSAIAPTHPQIYRDAHSATDYKARPGYDLTALS